MWSEHLASPFAIFLAYPISRHAATASKQSSCSLVANPARNSNHLHLKPLQSGGFRHMIGTGDVPPTKRASSWKDHVLKHRMSCFPKTFKESFKC